jgi:hypothetical protein
MITRRMQIIVGLVLLVILFFMWGVVIFTQPSVGWHFALLFSSIPLLWTSTQLLRGIDSDLD